MELRSSATATFDAQHQIPGYEPCARSHGHFWTIEVEAAGDLDPKTGWVRGSENLATYLGKWAGELDRGNLAELLPDAVTSPLGIASAALDALALRFPIIVAVRVSCSDGTKGEIRRTPRQL